ncbi:glycoside hydrolase family 18 protein [Chitinophagaceae bacterium LB-8]|uniref:chitinase n=1 Tax=Paraflavisolibacter caeni TaxID=2982496 RepID=A0A9X2Y128_9BACT|nr:glycoside hydrolase family 18 protein [Paraflavisolibacter caeni]MCU7552760.1 glycoside hydrolase family 18 protein [Paraflavisolibacter caeni]
MQYILIVFLCFIISFFQLPGKPVVIGYVAGYNGIINTSEIDISKLTHINYAFVDIKDKKAWLHNENTDTINFRQLNLLKQKNPLLKILISIGGWSWSKNFSDAVLSDSSRQVFAASAVHIIQQYDLDGIDIDWEYPNMKGDGNIFRPEDKQNYTLMFKEIRRQLDNTEKKTRKKYLLTTAVGGFPTFIDNTDMQHAAQYLDYINLMTYDYSWGVAGHHTNLYPSISYENENSTQKAVNIFTAAGVPRHRLVIGIAFYGRSCIVNDSAAHGLHQKAIASANGSDYGHIKDSLVNQNGFVRYWDEKAKAPYLFNQSNKQFISYDDEQSVTEKCKFVKEQKLGGVMFWEYSCDPKGYLLKTIHQQLIE